MAPSRKRHASGDNNHSVTKAKRTKQQQQEEEEEEDAPTSISSNALSEESLLLPFTKKICKKIMSSAGIGEPGVSGAVTGRWREDVLGEVPVLLRDFVAKTTEVALGAKRKTVTMEDVTFAMKGTAWMNGDLGPPLELTKTKTPFASFVHRKPFEAMLIAAYQAHYKETYPKQAKKSGIRLHGSVMKYAGVACCKIIYRKYQVLAKEKLTGT